MSLQYSRFLPSFLRMHVVGAMHNAREARRTLFLPLRPSCQSRLHIQEKPQEAHSPQTNAPSFPTFNTSEAAQDIGFPPISPKISLEPQPNQNLAIETSQTTITPKIPTHTKQAHETYAVHFQTHNVTLQVSGNQTILEAGLDVGLDLDFSCQVGGCASCKIKLLSGEVEMEEPHCLMDDEREEGYCLACIAKPKSALVLE